MTLRRLKAEHILPTEQLIRLVSNYMAPPPQNANIYTYGLNCSIWSLVDGFIRYLPSASQVVALNGQHCDADTVLLAAHVVLVQSCTAPIVCPISWAITFHSVDVLAITLAPLTVDVSCVCASITHSCPSQAKPTDAPVSQVVRSVHSAFESERVPRQAEKRFSRSSIVTLLEQGTFHSAVDGAVPGQFASVMTSVERPSVMLNVLSNKSELPASQSLTPPKTKPLPQNARQEDETIKK